MFDYKDKELWDVPMQHRNNITYRELMINTGGKLFDVDKFINSEIGSRKMKDIAHFIRNPNEAAPEVLDYWRSLGMTKQIHENTEIGVKWASYVPDGITREVPMFVDICQNPYGVETFGFIQYAAKEKIILIAPYDHSIKSVLAVVEYMKAHYPVDKSRVYIQGFSYGGIMATWLGLAAPKIFAGVNCAGTIEPIFYPGEIESMSESERRRRCFGDDFAYERMATIHDYALEAGKYGMPFIINTGLTELRSTLPLPVTPDVPLGGWLDKCKMRGFNMLNRVNGRREFYFDEYREALKSSNLTEAFIGVFFDSTEQRNIYGVEHYIGDLMNSSGHPIIRYIGIENLPHEPSPSSPALLWEFLRRFRRNTETGELIIEEAQA